MIVYIEDCLIENFVVTLLIIKSINLMFKFKTSRLRLVFACILGACLATIYPLFNLNGWLLTLLKLSVGFLIVATSYKQNLFSKYVIFMVCTALYGGLNVATYFLVYGTTEINDNFATYILLAFLWVIYFLIVKCIKIIQKQAVINCFVYKVKITDGKTIIFSNAFLDSGNTLLDEDSTPILIINYKLFNKLYCDIQMTDLLMKNYKSLKSPHYVKSGFASGGAKILVFCVDEVQIMAKDTSKTLKNAKLGVSYAKFSKNFNCDMLLNINTFV